MIRRLARAIERWHHRQVVKDLEHIIWHHSYQLAALPAEIKRINELRRFHLGRIATLTEQRSTVSFTLAGRTRSP